MNYKKRRKYLVHSSFQLKFAMGFILAALIGSIFSAFLFHFLATRQLEQLQWTVHINAGSAKEGTQQIFILVNTLSLIFVTILFAVTGFRMLKKINGPVYRLNKTIDSIKNGNLTQKLHLRQKDEFGDVAKNIDDMKEQLRRRFKKSKIKYERISTAIGQFDKPGFDQPPKGKSTQDIIFLLQKLRSQYP